MLCLKSELVVRLLVPTAAELEGGRARKGATTCLLSGLGALAGPLNGSGLPGVHSQLRLLQQAVQLHSDMFVKLNDVVTID